MRLVGNIAEVPPGEPASAYKYLGLKVNGNYTVTPRFVPAAMGLFYAYLKHTKAQDDAVWRHLIVFANREAADEWWRTLSTYPSPFVGYITRVSPQFYVQTGTPTIPPGYFEQLYGKAFLTVLNKTTSNGSPEGILSVAPPAEITDHISGKWYFIRSKSDPQRCWYFRNDGTCLVCGERCSTIHVSTKFRSRFHIQACNPPKELQASDDLVLIGKDEVSIAATKEYLLRVNDAEELQATKTARGGLSEFLFGDLKNRFSTRVERQNYGDGFHEYIVPVERGFGEAWELVD